MNNKFLLMIFTKCAFLVVRAVSFEPLDSVPDSDREAAQKALELIVSARDILWTGQGQANAVRLEYLLKRAASEAESIGDVAVFNYLMARVELNRSRLASSRNAKKKEIISFSEKSIKFAESSLEVKETSEGLRVLADAYSFWMVNKGLFAIISTAGKVKKLSEKALVLDPQNALAELINIQGQIQAPKSAEGDPLKAKERLLRLNRRSDLNKVERFWTRTSLALTYAKLKDWKEGKKWCRSAEEIFPDNVLVQECRETLKIRD